MISLRVSAYYPVNEDEVNNLPINIPAPQLDHTQGKVFISPEFVVEDEEGNKYKAVLWENGEKDSIRHIYWYTTFYSLTPLKKALNLNEEYL